MGNYSAHKKEVTGYYLAVMLFTLNFDCCLLLILIARSVSFCIVFIGLLY